MTLEDRLRTHREKTARIAVLELEIEGLEAEIKYSSGILETDDETIEGMAYRRSLEGGSGGDNTSKVERVVLNFKAEQDRLAKPQDVSYLYTEIRKRKGELKRLLDDTLPIEKALKGLSDKQKLIVDEFYVKGNTWYAVGTRYQQIYGYPVAQVTLRKTRDRALKKLSWILGA